MFGLPYYHTEFIPSGIIFIPSNISLVRKSTKLPLEPKATLTLLSPNFLESHLKPGISFAISFKDKTRELFLFHFIYNFRRYCDILLSLFTLIGMKI